MSDMVNLTTLRLVAGMAPRSFAIKSFAIKLSFLVVFFVAIPQMASAANWYVDNTVSRSGDGASWASAWRNFSDIVWGSISPGDTLYISGGKTSQTYFETLMIGASGSRHRPITITKGVDAGHNGTVILDEQNVRSNGIYSYGQNWLTIENLNVRNVGNAGIVIKSASAGVVVQNNSVYSGIGKGSGANARGYDVRNSSGVTILENSYSTPPSTTSQTDGIWSSGNNGVIFEDNTIVISNADTTGHSDGIQSYQDNNITIRRNYVAQLNGGKHNHGMWLSNTVTGGTVQIYNNIVFMPMHDATAVAHWNQNYPIYSGRAIIYNNTIYGGNPGILLQDTPLSEAKNNIIWTNSADRTWGAACWYLRGDIPASSTIDYNLSWAPNGIIAKINDVSQSWEQWQAAGRDAHGLNADPQFYDISSQDFRLKKGSPAINSGVNIDGLNSDDTGSAPDIGAHGLRARTLPVLVP